MNWNYLKVFCGGAILGTLNEYRLFEKQPTLMGSTIGNAYGWGATLIYAIHNMNIPIGISLLVITLMLIFLECLIGKISYIIRGEKTWNYGECFCDGYVHPISSMYFAIVATVLLISFKVIENRKSMIFAM